MTTDPIADFLTRIRNAVRARHASVEAPYSTIKERLAAVLQVEGFISEYHAAGEGTTKVISVTLRYADDGRAAIVGIRRVSRPGLRSYSSASEAPRVRGGLGVSILSTPIGLLSDREARRRNAGGEVLCEVW
ncbi:MAG: small subunit ribosomal protein S8 [Hyphomicrobiaceae bacterium]|jgi:small subunit ribosomal protein S8